MEKVEFKQGDAVIGKKWSGNPIIGIYEYTNTDGSHIVLDVENERRFNIKVGDLKLASDTEAATIKKMFKLKNLKLSEKPQKITFGKKTKKEEEFEILLAGDEEDTLD